MKTADQLQAAVNAVRAVCEDYGVVLLGVCVDESVHSEIEVIDAATLNSREAERVTNAVISWPQGSTVELMHLVYGIGTVLDPSKE